MALATLTVTSLADGPVDLTDAAVTLRDAVHAANNNLQVAPGAPTGGGVDEIRFQAGLVGAITLNLGRILISSDLAITGPGANLLTISGNNASRHFEVNDSTAGVKAVSISGLTLAFGAAEYGGAVYNLEHLTITGSTIRDNLSTVSGGGIYNGGPGTLNVQASTISGNAAVGDGGGFCNYGVVTVQNSTFSGNVADSSGGGVASFAGIVTMQNATITENRADFDHDAEGQGGGIWFVDTTMRLHNSIVSGNYKFDASSEIVASNGAVHGLSSNNLIGFSDTGGVVNGVNGNQVGVGDAELLPLANNGGPTFTHAMLISSRAINAGNNAQAPGGTDQRGGANARIAYGTVDIGAFEFQPVSLIVGTDVDEDDGNYTPADLSLREAIALANRVDGLDVITFSPSFFNVPRTITLISDLILTSDQTIAGPGAGLLTISGNNATPVFNVTDPTPTVRTVAISGLTVTGGNTGGAGGGIFNRENLTVTACTIRENFAETAGGGIFNFSGATLSLQNCIISGNTADDGGGIYNAGALTLQNSTVSGNTANKGGGIANEPGATLTVQTSTISGNAAANGEGGGIWTSGVLNVQNVTISTNTASKAGGGGIANHGFATVQNSTISGNLADFGGGIFSSGSSIHAYNTLIVENSTITQNYAKIASGSIGGGIFFNYSTVTLRNAIVAGNYSASAPVRADDISSHFGYVTSGSSFNLVGTAGSGLTNGVNGNLVGVGDAGLGPLANNGGPTMTHALLASSPAFNAGNNAQAPGSTDQRGFARIAHGTVDIGAFELQPVGSLVVGTNEDEDDGNYTPGDLSLREALALANGIAGPDVITFSSFFNTPRTITLTQGQLGLRSDLTINGPGAALLTIDANNAGRVLDVTDFSPVVRNVAISGLTITGGSSPVYFGGGIINRENLTITGSTVRNNSGYAGAGIYNFDGANLTLDNCAIIGNVGNFAGGIANSGVALIQNSTISGNNTTNSVYGGGGVYNFGTLTVQNSTISGNHGEGVAGGVFNATPAMLTVQNSTISGNTAGFYGGGVSNLGVMTILSSTVTGNGLDGGTIGGGLYLGPEAVTALYNTIVADNFVGPPESREEQNILGGSFLSVTSSNNLLGVGISGGLINGVNGNQVGVVNPGLGPLANNGGPTLTHALLGGSPAINMGNPSFVTPPNFDQRGAPYLRVAGGRLDVGAFEAQGAVAPSANFDGDADVDGHDFLRWQRGLGTQAPNAVKANGDADNDQDVDAADLAVWKSQFGNPPPAALALAASALPSLSDLGSAVAETQHSVSEKPHNSAADAVFAAGDFTRFFATSAADDFDHIRSYRARRRR